MTHEPLFDLSEAIKKRETAVLHAKKKFLLAKFAHDNFFVPEDLPITAVIPSSVSAVGNHDEAVGGYPKLPEFWISWSDRDDKNADDNRRREILSSVMSVYKCLFGDPVPDSTTRYFDSYMPDSIYKGVGKINGYRVVIRFDAPWPPPGCTWEEVTQTTAKLICQKE